MPVGKARLKVLRSVAARGAYSCGLAVLVTLFATRGLQNAVAEGDTRTISMHHLHTGEDITITYKRDGRYDEAALEKLNWFLRDWRRGRATQMDPHLIDLVWEVQREAGSKEPIQVVCGYRSPETNAMLRHRSSGVARFSQHMLGKAMDFYIPGVALSDLRVIGLRLQRGGVGFYPTSGSPFVHMDTGGIRMWPRMTREELVRVFPDGRTVLIPTDGRPLPGYALALAEIRKRGSDPSENSLEAARAAGIELGPEMAAGKPFNPFAKLFGLAKEDDDEADAAPANAPQAAPIRSRVKAVAVAAVEHAKKFAERKLARVAAAVPPPKPPGPPGSSTDAAVAQSSPRQVVLARGYWAGTPEESPAAQSIVAAALRSTARAPADGDAGITGSIPAAGDNTSNAIVLGYAEQVETDSPAQAAADAATATRAAAAKTGLVIGESGTTVAAKGVVDRPRTSMQKAIALASAAVKVGLRRDSPWIRALILSPSVHRFLTTLALGANDLTKLATLMAKPKSVLMMTFSADPTHGLTDHFRGSAVVFLSTVTYPTHTASLQ